MLCYPARLIPNEDGTVTLTLPDVPEVAFAARNEEDAFERAPAVLDAVLAGHVLERRSIPSPSDICGAPRVCTEQFSVLGVD